MNRSGAISLTMASCVPQSLRIAERSRRDARAGLLIEHVHPCRIDAELDPVSRIHRRPPVRHEHDLRGTRLHQKLGLGAHRLDDDDLAWYCMGAGAERQVFGPDTVRHYLAI